MSLHKHKVPEQGKQSEHIIVSHTSDLDGRISRELYIYFTGIPDDTPTVWVEYGELIEKAQQTISEWATGRDVTILDFSISQAFLDAVAEVAETVLLFDHHTGTKELVAPKNTTIVCDTDESTVSLLQKYYKGYETLFTNVCREIDLNMIEEPMVLGHKLHLDSIFFDEEKNLQEELDRMFDDCSVPEFYHVKAKEQLKKAEKLASEAKIDREDRTAYIHRDGRHRGIDTDILAHFMLQNRKIDFAIISFDQNNEKRIFSVRKLKENPRSLEEYVESRGGGGRETAGAFRMSIAQIKIAKSYNRRAF